MGNLLNVWGGLKAHRASQDPRSKCLERNKTKKLACGEVSTRALAMAPSLGEGVRWGRGIWGTLPRSLVSGGGVTATQEQKK